MAFYPFYLRRETLENVEARIIRVERDINTATEQHKPFVHSLGHSAHQLHFLQNTGYLIDLISAVERLSVSIKSISSGIGSAADEKSFPKLSVGDIAERIKKIEAPWSEISRIDTFLRPLPCDHTKSHVTSRISQLRANLQQSLRVVYERGYTKLLGWPSPLPEADLRLTPESRLSEFNPLFVSLVDIQTRFIDCQTYRNVQNSGEHEGLWALDWLLDRIRLSFRFSFRGKQATNRIDKPDWHAAFVLQTLRSHSAFLRSLSDLLSTSSVSLSFVHSSCLGAVFARYCDFATSRIVSLFLILPHSLDAELYFAYALVREVRDKLKADISLILEQQSAEDLESLFWLTLNETLAFDKSLRRQLSLSAADFEGSISVFTEDPKILQRWISLEVKCPLEYCQAFLC